MQFFLAEINLYCYTNNIISAEGKRDRANSTQCNADFGLYFEANADTITDGIRDAVLRGDSIEDHLLGLIKRNVPGFYLTRELTAADKSKIKANFENNFMPILLGARAPHYDEFFRFLPGARRVRFPEIATIRDTNVG